MAPIQRRPTGHVATASQERPVREPAIVRVDRGVPPRDRPWWSEWAAEQRAPIAPSPLRAPFGEPASDANDASEANEATSLELMPGELI
jgi:hypothetical protein